MAKTQNKTPQSKPKSSLFLCCFGFSRESYIENIPEVPDHSLKGKRKSRWFSWQRTRMKKSSTKTVPLDASNEKPEPKRRAKLHPSRLSKSKSKSKSNLFNTETPASNLPPPSQTVTVVPAAPNQTPSQTRHGIEPNRGDNRRSRKDVASAEEDTRQKNGSFPSRATPTISSSVSLTKRHVPRLSSSSQSQTTPEQSRRLTKAKRYSYDPVVGMSVIMVTLIIMILWGRFCAVLSTAAWLYFIPRFRTTIENDKNLTTNSDDMDLDSKVYKKKVVLEGLLERNHNHNHRGRL